MSKTGRHYITTKDGRIFCIEPIDNSNGKSTQWGDQDPVTGKLTGSYGNKNKGSIHEDESIITEDNGFKNIKMCSPGTSPYTEIEKLIKN